MSEAQEIVDALKEVLDTDQLRELYLWMKTKREALEFIREQPFF